MVVLEGSVGEGGTNREADVRALQEVLTSLADALQDSAFDPRGVDGAVGRDTVNAIVAFQRDLRMRDPDGRVDPGGRTLARLNARWGIAKAVWAYPLPIPATRDVVGEDAGPRAFGAWRKNGRAHAGIDLYAPLGTRVMAMAKGTVARAAYSFYAETYAVEVDHGCCVVRYGEVDPDTVAPLQDGDPVEAGQTLGQVGELIGINVPSPMLHLEMYDKTVEGPLTRRGSASAKSLSGRRFYRRRDLIDPSPFVCWI